MSQKINKSKKIINILLVIFSLLLLLTPWFMANSKYLGWGSTAFSYVTVPLLMITPLLLLMQFLLLIKVKSGSLYWRVLTGALVVYAIMLILATN